MPEKPMCFDAHQTNVSSHMVIAMYQEFRPDRRLAPWVECAWTRSGSATRSLRVMPDGCVDLFVSSSGDVMIAGQLVAGSPITASSVTTWACCSNSAGAPAAGDAYSRAQRKSLVSLWFQWFWAAFFVGGPG